MSLHCSDRLSVNTEITGGLHEECGVFGVFSTRTFDIYSPCYYGLYALQHRGQEGCGIVVNDDGVFTSYKDLGLVEEVFSHDVLTKLGQGNIAVGHCLYGTVGKKARANCQPIEVNHIKGRLALANNGCLTNAYELRQELELHGAIFHTTSDTEIIPYLITQERLISRSIEEAVCKAMYRLDGAYSLVVMSPSKLIAVRDPHGIRPLCYGRTDEGDYIVASETCALEACGAHFIREVRPGEVLVFSKDGVYSIDEHVGKKKPALCVFEYFYFARPDSVIDGVSVHKARKTAGRFLAKEHPVEADVVIGVPDSGIDAAIGYAEESGIPYGLGFIKNKYIGRTFIVPGQAVREDMVRIKLNPISDTVKGKRVVLVDDSIVRGTTCARIVGLLRDAGATEVHMRSSAPPFIAPCYYGTDIDSKDKLIACRNTLDEIKELLGVDSIGYLEFEDMLNIAGEGRGDTFCTACFNEVYPTGIPDNTLKNRYESKISKKEQVSND